MPMMSSKTNSAMAHERLLNGERAKELRVSRVSVKPERWAIVLDYGWAETIIATCDYPDHTIGVAHALAAVLDCPIAWLDLAPAMTGGET